MTVLTEGSHNGEGLVAELPGLLSRKTVTLISGQNLAASTVLGKITASGKYTQLAPAAADGSETAAAILYGATDASGGDTDCVIVYKIAAYVADVLGWPDGITSPQKTTALSQLDAVGIVTR